MGVLYQYFSEQKKEEFRYEALYLLAAVEHGGIELLENLPTYKKGEVVFRITVLTEDGQVSYDNVVDADQLDSPKEREEIGEAIQNGVGESSRYSTTLGERTYNYALRMQDGQVRRISVSQ